MPGLLVQPDGLTIQEGLLVGPLICKSQFSMCAEYEVDITNNSGGPKPCRPFRITFPPPPPKRTKAKKRKATEDASANVDDVRPTAKPRLSAESYVAQDPGPYPQDKPPENPVRFTPVQVRHFLLDH